MSETSRLSAAPGDRAAPAPAVVLRPVGPRKLLEILLVPASDGIPVRIEAYPGERYELKDPRTGKAPRQLRVWLIFDVLRLLFCWHALPFWKFAFIVRFVLVGLRRSSAARCDSAEMLRGPVF